MALATHSEVPVLIVGGGAAGTVLTAELRRRGIQSRTIDKMAAPSSASRAFTVHSRTLEMIERLDENLLKRYLDRGLKTHGFAFNFKNLDDVPKLDFRQLNTKYPSVLIHRQDETEEWIREYLKEKLDYEVEWNTRLVEFSQDAEGVTAKLVHTDHNDREEIVRARYMVACDGIHSFIRKELRVDYEGHDYTGMVFQNCDVTLEGYNYDDDWIRFFMAKDQFLLIVKLPGGNYRLLLSDMGEAADPKYTPREAFQMVVDRFVDGVTLGEPDWASKWEIWMRIAGTYREGNIFLAGDSAHVHSPAGGQGMNCCMQDANNLAWKLALVLEDKAAPSLLDTYELERKPIAEQVIEGASAIHEVIMGHGVDLEKRHDITEEAGWLEKRTGRVSGISYTYRDYIEQPEDLAEIQGPAIGDRAPDASLSGNHHLFSLFRHPHMNLLLMPATTESGELDTCKTIKNKIDQTYSEDIRTYTILHDRNNHADNKSTFIDEKGEVAGQYGQSGQGCLYFIRPDGYIGHRCLLSEEGTLYNYLDSFLIKR